MTAAQEKFLEKKPQDAFEQVITSANRIILGKDRIIRLALSCMLARGHLLIEDQPGVGKTTLANVLASLLGLNLQRIQFTSDLLPADILGVSVYSRETESFSFHPGPIFAQLILADEVNRATPRAQSALLEAMEEQQVTIEGDTRPLPDPFFVIATQNPSSQIGTFPLPESQLDRFTMRIQLGYPDSEAERELLQGQDRSEILSETAAILKTADLKSYQKQVKNVHVADALLDYLQNLLEFSRVSADYSNGLSPRSGLAILHCAKAWALLHGHEHVLPEDIQAILPSVIGHRLKPAQEVAVSSAESVAESLIQQVPIP
jgi:MoxR-like ATPase